MLKNKGVLNDKEAENLSQTLSKKSSSVIMQRKYTLEVIAVGILAVIFAYLFMQMGISKGSADIENVSATLNATREGISSTQSFGLLFMSAVVFVFVLLYLLAHRYYNRLWSWQKNMLAYAEMIADMQKRKEVLEEEITSLLENQTKHSNNEVLINTDSPDTTKQAMEIFERLSCELGDIEIDYAMLKAQCRKDSVKFPYTLATMVGPLPTCN